MNPDQYVQLAEDFTKLVNAELAHASASDKPDQIISRLPSLIALVKSVEQLRSNMIDGGLRPRFEGGNYQKRLYELSDSAEAQLAAIISKLPNDPATVKRVRESTEVLINGYLRRWESGE